MTGWHSNAQQEELKRLLPPDSLFGRQLSFLDCVDSTNTRLAALARAGAPEGTVLLAEEQTAGRGTGSRSFSSLRGKGLYLSLLLRPQAPLSQLLTLTGRTAAAVRDGIEDASGAPVTVKWLNDIHLLDRKVCGILTELGDGFVVVGIGVNLTQTHGDFRAQGLADLAVSLAQAGYPASPASLAAAILTRMEEMYRTFPEGLEDSLRRYRTHCTTPGRAISFFAEGQLRTGRALSVQDDFSLLAEDLSGRRHTVAAGTVTLL